MARIYTRTGDDGTTYCMLLRGRVSKAHPLIEFMGALDEANSALGLAASQAVDEDVKRFLEDLQRILFRVGFHLSGTGSLEEDTVKWLEEKTDEFLGDFEFKGFILPGGSPSAAAIHLARSIVRRAERRLVEVVEKGIVERDRASLPLRVLNRASDALFAAAVREAEKTGRIVYL